MTYLFIERELHNKTFKSGSFVGSRGERYTFYRKTDEIISKMLERKELSDFTLLMDVAYEYSSLLIFEGNFTEAFNCYYHIYCKLEYGNYLGETRDFIKLLNKVELYYNLGIIAKEYLNDFDSAMYYFGEAGEEYSEINKVTTEDFFRDEMIDKPERAFWNFSGDIHQNCFGYSSFATAFHYKSVFGYETDKTIIQKLLKDFKFPLLLQFVFTISSYFKWLSLSHNIIKGVRITRVFGELAWLFECYLKQKLNYDKLRDLLNQFVKNKPFKSSFHSLCSAEVDGKDSILALERLLKLQEDTIDFNTKQSICLLITYVMRNYSSHNLDDNFFAFSDDKFTKKILFSCLLSFFIVLNYSYELA